ncbi:DUF5064 family protein [Stutzerimonas stutzeri]|uniref:DUF5064 domain-containing protein n=1 Tax=Stutzerimonas stutzeri RCH2 TaxID=644801 RepID=L0GHJ2_STUST|nr:DUF5064 family protein [Stutzerimonas stutzeri]AGA84885.1 hypothetical protein Psest_0274 [Stutzerimonas stutzeri RCH2]
MQPDGMSRGVAEEAFVFRPGNLQVRDLPSADRPAYRLLLDYRVEDGVAVPRWAYFHLRGEVGQIVVDEQFRMHRDVACNFLQKIRQCLRQHGAPVRSDVVFGFHRLYDPLFEDLRRQLRIRSGEPVDLERFLRDERG